MKKTNESVAPVTSAKNTENMNEIKANANTGLIELDRKAAFEVMDKLYTSAEKADQVAAKAWATMLLVARKAKIKASEVAERYGVSKDYINMIQRGALLLDTGKTDKKGLPILSKSPLAVVDPETKAVTDYTIQKLARLKALGDLEDIRKFIEETGCTPEWSQAKLIQAISDYKNPKPETSEAETTEASEAETPEASKSDVEASEVASGYTLANNAVLALQQCKLASNAPEEWNKILDMVVKQAVLEGWAHVTESKG